MANTALAPARLLFEPGYLYWAPLGSPLPANTVVAGAYTDTWPTPFVPLGPTDSGSDFTYTSTVQPVAVAELYDPAAYRTTDRSGNFGFALASITSGNLTKSFNGAVTAVTGTGATQNTDITPVPVGSETRCMIGWESADSTMRIVAFQVMNSGSIKLSFNKAPARTTIPWVGNFELPQTAGAVPWKVSTTR